MIVFVTDICLTCYRNNPMRTNEDVSHYTTLAGNCFKWGFFLHNSVIGFMLITNICHQKCQFYLRCPENII